MGKLNKFTAFMGNKFQPVFGKIVYRNMRRKPIVPKELKRLSDLAPLDKDKVQLVAHRGLSGAYPETPLRRLRRQASMADISALNAIRT